MGKHVVAEAVGDEGIEGVVVAINGPVLAEFLRAENQHALVFQLEVFDDGERLEGFAQADAVGKDAAVVLEDLVDRAFDAVALELEKGLPNLRVHDLDVLVEQAALFLVGEEVFKDVEEGFVVDEFRRVVLVKLVEVLQDFLPSRLPPSAGSFQSSSNQAFRSRRSRLLSTSRFSSMLLLPAPRPRPRTVKLELPRMASSTPALAM